MPSKKDLVSCVRGLYVMGLTTSISGNHSIRSGPWIWITPSGVPRYNIRLADLVKVSLESGRILGRNTPSIELEMHRRIYLERPDVNAIVHTHSPFTIGVSISSNFVHILEEAEIVVGVPATIVNRPSGSKALAESVAREFRKGAHAVIVKNHGVVTVGKDIHHARAVVESLEGWSKILTISKIFGGARSLLRN